MACFRRFLREEEAATAVEYAVMLGLILMTVIGAIGTFGANSGNLWGGIVDDLAAVGFMGN